MIPGYVNTIREEIFFEFAKLISRSSLKGNVDYPFVLNRFKALQSGRITITGTNREWSRDCPPPDACTFCGATGEVAPARLVPLISGGGSSEENTVLTCAACASSRAYRSVFQWLGLTRKDSLDHVLFGRYLQLLYGLHAGSGSLDIHKNDLYLLCTRCPNRSMCIELDVAGELTCLCLESVL